LLIFNLAYPEGGLVSFQVFRILQDRSGSTDVDGSDFHFPPQHLFFSYGAASFTSGGAPIHLHFSGLPIDLWIMVLEPGVAKDHVLLPEIRDS